MQNVIVKVLRQNSSYLTEIWLSGTNDDFRITAFRDSTEDESRHAAENWLEQNSYRFHVLRWIDA